MRVCCKKCKITFFFRKISLAAIQCAVLFIAYFFFREKKDTLYFYMASLWFFSVPLCSHAHTHKKKVGSKIEASFLLPALVTSHPS